MKDAVERDRDVRRPRSRSWLVAAMVVITTLAGMLTATSGVDVPVRLAAGALAVVGAVGSLRLSRRRSDLVGWYLLVLGVGLLRMIFLH